MANAARSEVVVLLSVMLTVCKAERRGGIFSGSLCRMRESCRNRLRMSRIGRLFLAQNPSGARLIGLQTLSLHRTTALRMLKEKDRATKREGRRGLRRLRHARRAL